MRRRETREVYKEIAGMVLKWAAALAIFIFSVTLSFSFYNQITPPDKPWFPIAALGLTEIGFVCWLASFLLTHQDTESDIIALVMVVLCGAATIVVDSSELARMFSNANMQVSYPWMGTLVYTVLIFLLGCHMVSFFLELVLGYFKAHPVVASANFPSRTTEAIVEEELAVPTRLPAPSMLALPPALPHRTTRLQPPYEERRKQDRSRDDRVWEEEEEEEEGTRISLPLPPNGHISRQPVRVLSQPPAPAPAVAVQPALRTSPGREEDISPPLEGLYNFLSHVPSRKYPPHMDGRKVGTTSTTNQMRQAQKQVSPTPTQAKPPEIHTEEVVASVPPPLQSPVVNPSALSEQILF